MRKYYENFLFFNGHSHIVNFIQIDISLHLSSISTEVFQPTLLMSVTNIEHYFSKLATIYCIAFWHILRVNNIEPTWLNLLNQSKACGTPWRFINRLFFFFTILLEEYI